MSVQSTDNWPELEELRHWLVEDVAPHASNLPAIFRLITSDGMHWLAEAIEDEKGSVRASVYWESSDDSSCRTHEWDAIVEGDICRGGFE